MLKWVVLIITALMDHRDHTTPNRATIDYEGHPLITGADRLAIFQEACGMFERREEEMLKELAYIRSGFSENSPAFPNQTLLFIQPLLLVLICKPS
jgi:hypothetical protein